MNKQLSLSSLRSFPSLLSSFLSFFLSSKHIWESLFRQAVFLWYVCHLNSCDEINNSGIIRNESRKRPKEIWLAFEMRASLIRFNCFELYTESRPHQNIPKSTYKENNSAVDAAVKVFFGYLLFFSSFFLRFIIQRNQYYRRHVNTLFITESFNLWGIYSNRTIISW